jgi:mRNA-degrading endonuclease toxin of MazEF toxin-antitoxin module
VKKMPDDSPRRTFSAPNRYWDVLEGMVETGLARNLSGALRLVIDEYVRSQQGHELADGSAKVDLDVWMQLTGLGDGSATPWSQLDVTISQEPGEGTGPPKPRQNMHRGDIWLRDGNESYLLVPSAHYVTARGRPPTTWGFRVTRDAAVSTVGEPFAVQLSSSQTGVDGDIWVQLAAGIHPLSEDSLTRRVGVVSDRGLERVEAAVRLLYDL